MSKNYCAFFHLDIKKCQSIVILTHYGLLFGNQVLFFLTWFFFASNQKSCQKNADTNKPQKSRNTQKEGFSVRNIHMTSKWFFTWSTTSTTLQEKETISSRFLKGSGRCHDSSKSRSQHSLQKVACERSLTLNPLNHAD